MAIKLQEAGITDFVVLERGDSVGGTWRDNTYPGAACDIETVLYSYSFEPNPNWSRAFGVQAEIRKYIEYCVDKYGVREQIQCNKNVVKARFDEEAGLWEVHTEDGSTYRARIAVTGTGPLNKAVYPNIPGRDSFAGAAFHSSHWDHSFDHKGKRVAVIGTGASAIQVVPGIAADVAELKLFQRTPAWVVPRPDRKISGFEHWMFKTIPFTQWISRTTTYWMHESVVLPFIKFPGALRLFSKVARWNIRRAIKDPELAEQLTPKYTMGCKRVLLSSDYYPAIARENVKLVTTGIESITPKCIKTKDGVEHEVDCIVYATGFDASENQAPFTTLGLNDVDLQKKWQHGGEAYLGCTVSGFPNLFILVGPNTGLGHSSMIHIIESQCAYAMQGIQAILNKQYKYVDVLPYVQQKFNEGLQEDLQHTVWNLGGCQSWYINEDGKNTTLWPHSTVKFRRMTAHFNEKDYEVVAN